MSDFDTSKWFKQQYLAEANLTEEKLSYIPPDAFYAIYNILKSEVPEVQSEYGTASYFGMQMREKLDMYGPGEEILMRAGLKEAPEENLNEGPSAALKQKIKDAQEILRTGMADGVPLDNETEMLVQQELAQLKKQAAVEFLRTKR